jgi:putative aldouronate transport system substrate-binding protein
MVMQIINYGFDDPDLGMVQDALNELTIPEIGVEVEFLTTPIMEQATKLGLLVSGGQQIDLVVAGLLTTPSNLVSDGLLQPITEYVESSEALSSLAEGIIDACKVNGEIYAYPGSMASANQVTFFYDKDLADEYGIEVPDAIQTEEQWDALFEAVKESGMPVYGISLGDGVACEYEWTPFDSLGADQDLAYGVVMDALNGDTVVNYYATDEYMQKCKMHRKWFEEGYCVPDSISNGYTTTDSMTQGMIFGFVSNGSPSISKAYMSKITGKNIEAAPMADIITKTSGVVNFSWGVSTSCERPEKVVEFLEMLYTNKDVANLLSYGIEGVHYTTTEGSQIIGYPEGVDAMNCGYGSFVGSFGNILDIYQREPYTDEDIASFSDFIYPNAPSSKFMGYTFDPSNVSTALTAVSAVIGQYAPALECGIVDPEEMIPEFVSALEDAGMNEIIAENQAQLDAWLAAK